MLTVKIKMEGSAFDEPHTHYEVARILGNLGDTVERNLMAKVGHGCVEKDSNGNYCATLDITEEVEA